MKGIDALTVRQQGKLIKKGQDRDKKGTGIFKVDPGRNLEDTGSYLYKGQEGQVYIYSKY